MATARTKIMFMIAFILALSSAWVANSWVQQRALEAGKNTQLEMQQVVVAALDIPFGHALESRHLTLKEWPAHLTPAGAFLNVDNVLGKVARVEILNGDVVTEQRLVNHIEGSHLAALIESNKRGVSVRVNDVIGVSGFLLPGNRVDVFAVKKKERGSEDVVVDTVLRNVKVLAVDQETSPDANNPKVVRAVTLELTPEESESLIKAMHEGKIQLALRNPDDLIIPKPVEVAPPPPPKQEIAQVAIKRPSVPKPEVKYVPPTPHSVMVIRGINVSEERPQN